MNTPVDDFIERRRPDAGAGPIGEAEKTAGVRITPGRAYGFFTDTTLCIGCKACEVACKQWNQLPAEDFRFKGASYDHTVDLGATTWRHVLFIEQFDEGRFQGVGEHGAEGPRADGTGASGPGADEPGADGLGAVGIGAVGIGAVGIGAGAFEPWANLTTSEAWAAPGQRWLFMSDVCKHCVHAPCLEACPTGSIIRTEFDSVYVQQDVCNGCGYCVSACPFGVVEVSKETDGKAHKCTLCYDRLKDGLEPACAKTCPTDSIQFGAVDELLERAQARVAELRSRGIPAYLYGTNGVLEDGCDTTALNGLNAFFLLIDRPEVYNLPPVARRPSNNTLVALAAGAAAAVALAGLTFLAFAGGGAGRAGGRSW